MEVRDLTVAGQELISQFSIKFLKLRLVARSKDIKDFLVMSTLDVKFV